MVHWYPSLNHEHAVFRSVSNKQKEPRVWSDVLQDLVDYTHKQGTIVLAFFYQDHHNHTKNLLYASSFIDNDKKDAVYFIYCSIYNYLYNQLLALYVWLMKSYSISIIFLIFLMFNYEIHVIFYKYSLQSQCMTIFLDAVQIIKTWEVSYVWYYVSIVV